MRTIIFSIIFLGILFGVSRFIFEPTYLYYEFLWLDIPMHILGGVGIAFFVSSILKFNNKNVSFLFLFLTYVIVALSWEVYEYIRGVIVYSDMSKWIDSMMDFFYGLLGVLLFYFFKKKY